MGLDQEKWAIFVFSGKPQKKYIPILVEKNVTFPQELDDLTRVTKVCLAQDDDWQWKKLIDTLNEEIKPEDLIEYDQEKDKRN